MMMIMKKTRGVLLLGVKFPQGRRPCGKFVRSGFKNSVIRQLKFICFGGKRRRLMEMKRRQFIGLKGSVTVTGKQWKCSFVCKACLLFPTLAVGSDFPTKCDCAIGVWDS